MLEFTRVIDIPRYISHTYTSRLDLFAKDTRKSLLLATIGVARPSLVLPVIRKFRATISRLAPIWHSFPTAATYFASPKPAVQCMYVCVCVFCASEPSAINSDLSPSGEWIFTRILTRATPIVAIFIPRHVESQCSVLETRPRSFVRIFDALLYFFASSRFLPEFF